MNVGELLDAIKELPRHMPVEAWTTGDKEFLVRVATIYDSTPLRFQKVLFLGNDPNEVDPRNEKLLHADEIEEEL